MRRLCWNPTLFSALSLLFFLLSIPLTWFLPPDWSKENGPIEWTQAILLVIGAIIAITVYLRGDGSFATRQLFLCSAPIWLTLLGRELSWGRVFYSNIGERGYVPLKQLWFGPYVYPGIALIFALVIWFMLKNDLHKEVLHWLKNGRFPAIDGLVLALAVATALLAEHQLGSMLGERHVLLEELAETVVYFSLIGLTVSLGFYSEFQPGASQAIRMKSAAARNL